MSLGERIKKARNNKGYTQQQLADIINVKRAAVHKYEKDLVSINTTQLKKIANALDVSPMELMGINDFDEKYPDLPKELSEYETMLSYLKSLGYNVEIIQIPLKSHDEEMIDSDGNVIGISTMVDEETVEYNITGNKISVTLSEDDFTRLKTSSADLISSFLWKKSQDNKK